MKLLRRKVTGNIYISEAISGIFDYKYADTVETGYEEAHLVGDVTTEADAIIKWGSVAEDDTLAAYKQAKYNAIDYKTGVLLSVGFTYDSKQFSLSANAQLNWSEIHSNIAEFPDPVDVTLINNDTYSLTHANVNTFWTTAKDILKGHLDSGRALKKSVFDAVDKAAVDAVIDNR